MTFNFQFAEGLFGSLVYLFTDGKRGTSYRLVTEVSGLKTCFFL